MLEWKGVIHAYLWLLFKQIICHYPLLRETALLVREITVGWGQNRGEKRQEFNRENMIWRKWWGCESDREIDENNTVCRDWEVGREMRNFRVEAPITCHAETVSTLYQFWCSMWWHFFVHYNLQRKHLRIIV